MSLRCCGREEVSTKRSAVTDYFSLLLKLNFVEDNVEYNDFPATKCLFTFLLFLTHNVSTTTS